MPRYRWSLVVPALLAVLVLLAGWRAAAGAGQLEVTYLNVGQGDSALLRGPDGFDVLIDGGPAGAGPTVAAYLRQQGVDDIDLLIASHNDADHIGGLLEVLAMGDIPVQQARYNGYPVDSAVYRQFATAAAQEGAELQALNFPQEENWGTMRASILNPAAGEMVQAGQNDLSVVVLVEYGALRLLFSGDIEAPGEAQILARGTPLAAQALKVAHHGSDTSSSPAFLQAVSPQSAIILVGENGFGHPSAEVLVRLEAIGARRWRTDVNGNIWLTSDGVNYSLTAQIMNPAYLPLMYKNH